MEVILTRRRVSGVAGLVLLALTIVSAPAACSSDLSNMSKPPGTTSEAADTVKPMLPPLSASHIPELMPESKTAVLGVQTGPTTHHSHNLLEE